MANQKLLEVATKAVTKAIEALEGVKRKLEREETQPQKEAEYIPEPAVYAPPPPSRPQPQPQTVSAAAQPDNAGGVIPQTCKTMTEAVQLAAAVCGQWKFQDDKTSVLDQNTARYGAEEQDAAAGLDEDDEESYYIISPDGAIGLTEDEGRTIDWLLLPLDRTVASMPKKVPKGTAWPEKASPVRDAEPLPVRDAEPPQPVADPFGSSVGNTCPKCGSPVNPGTMFCGNCGQRLEAPAPAPEPQERFCRQCGAPLKAGDKFCRNCGAQN